MDRFLSIGAMKYDYEGFVVSEDSMKILRSSTPQLFTTHLHKQNTLLHFKLHWAIPISLPQSTRKERCSKTFDLGLGAKRQ